MMNGPGGRSSVSNDDDDDADADADEEERDPPFSLASITFETRSYVNMAS